MPDTIIAPAMLPVRTIAAGLVSTPAISAANQLDQPDDGHEDLGRRQTVGAKRRELGGVVDELACAEDHEHAVVDVQDLGDPKRPTGSSGGTGP